MCVALLCFGHAACVMSYNNTNPHEHIIYACLEPPKTYQMPNPATYSCSSDAGCGDHASFSTSFLNSVMTSDFFVALSSL